MARAPGRDVGVTVAAALALLVLTRPAAAPTGGEAPIPCISTEMSVEHIHAHLQIFVRGQPRTVPANSGIRSTCLSWLHTHDATGLIHVEAGAGGKRPRSAGDSQNQV